MTGDDRVLSFVTQTTNQTSAAFQRPKWARGVLLYAQRISADPAVLANVGLALLIPLVAADKEWARFATNTDFDTTDYASLLLHPDPAATDFSATAPVAVVAANFKRLPLPDEMKVQLVNVSAVSLSIDVYAHWLA